MPDINGYISGKEGSVLVGGQAFPFGKFTLDMSGSGKPALDNWLTAPFGYVIGGIHRATLRLSGPYKFASMPITNLGSYIFTLGFFPGVFLQGTFLVTLKIDNDVEDAPRVEVSGTSQGAFGISLV